ncbi:OPT/YSL family transporter [bacterium]|nr:OPT/YSL family transporter [bacterium]
MDEKIRDEFQDLEIQEEFRDGFNLRTIWAALFIGFVMLPGTIYLGLMTGGGLVGAASWVTVILLVEISKRSFIELKRQELFVTFQIVSGLMSAGLILGAAGLTLQGGAFADLIWKQYLIQSPYAQSMGLHDKIPTWAVPPANSDAIIRRTFFHRAWLVPILLIVVHNVLYRINRYTMGYFLFRITSDRESLPFPMAPVSAEGMNALAESSSKKETWRWRVFSISAMIGIIFGAVYVVIPTITGLMMSNPVQLLPIPWIDFTDKIGVKFPAALLGISTELGIVLSGFVLPFWVVCGTFIGSVVANLIGNPILYKIGIIKNWHQGMTAIPTNIVASMDFWINVGIGSAIVVTITGLVKTIQAYIKKGKSTIKKKEVLPENRGDYPLPIALGLWFLSTLIYIVICKILVPAFPIILFVMFGFVLSPLLSYTSARMFGITGVAGGVSFPYVREGTFILSGYKGADIWFAPIPYFNHGGLAQTFKTLELTRTKFTSYYKASFTTLAIMLFCSFLFWSIIWRMAPIPSSTYPYVQKMWPMSAMFQTLWVTSTLKGAGSNWMLQAIKFSRIVPAAAFGGVLYVVMTLLKLPMGLFYGMIGGLGALPHAAFPMFAGALLGRFYFSKKIGPQWKRYTPIILAGYSCGMGLVGMVSVAVALIAKTVFQIIF